ncbi:hypothetical protein [Candidatus Nitrosocosmicus sp. FF01]|uniref:hypothetical protein n=1 Tax=Candidatus Nitrosocosmicus sp. FF01 TaxID=3397670 RepID=UPI0039E9E509
MPDSFFDLNPANDLSSEYVSGPLLFRIRRISIRLGLAITEKIILTLLDVDSNTPRLDSEGGEYENLNYKAV